MPEFLSAEGTIRQRRLAKSARHRAGNPRKEPRRQALLVLQHETLVARITEKLFHSV